MSRFAVRVLVLALALVTVAGPVAAVATQDPLAPTAAEAGRSPGDSAVDLALPPAGPVATADTSTARGGSWYALSEGTHLGLQLDAGAPDGAGLGLLFRPWWWVRLNGGLAYDYLGLGVRGGVSLVPVHWAVTPSLNLDYGHYFSGDATRFSSNATPAEQDLLRHAAYDFASAQLGLEFGSQRRFAFYVRGGIAYVTGSASASQGTALLAENLPSGYTGTANGDVTLRALIPCVSLGFLVYVY